MSLDNSNTSLNSDSNFSLFSVNSASSSSSSASLKETIDSSESETPSLKSRALSFFSSNNPFLDPVTHPSSSVSIDFTSFLVLLSSVLIYSIYLFYENSQRPDLTTLSLDSTSSMPNRIYLLSVESPDFVKFTWNYRGSTCADLIAKRFKMPDEHSGFIRENFSNKFRPASITEMINNGEISLPTCPYENNPNKIINRPGIISVPLCFISPSEFSSLDQCVRPDNHQTCTTIFPSADDYLYPIQLSFLREALLNGSEFKQRSNFSNSEIRINFESFDFLGLCLNEISVNLDYSKPVDYYVTIQVLATDTVGPENSDEWNFQSDEFCSIYRRSSSCAQQIQYFGDNPEIRRVNSISIVPRPVSPSEVGSKWTRFHFRIAPFYYRQHIYSTKANFLTIFSAVGGAGSSLFFVAKILNGKIKSFKSSN